MPFMKGHNYAEIFRSVWHSIMHFLFNVLSNSSSSNIFSGVSSFDKDSLISLTQLLPERIFPHLNIQELCRMSLVCKDWHHNAKVETLRRSQLQIVLVSLTSEFEKNFLECPKFAFLKDENYIARQINICPKVCIIFSGGLHNMESCLENIVIAEYYNKLPRDCSIVSIHFHGLSKNEQEIKASKNLGIAFFMPPSLPTKMNIKVRALTGMHITEAKRNYGGTNWLVQQLADEMLTRDNTNNCIIFFNFPMPYEDEDYYHDCRLFEQSFLTELRRRSEPGKMSLIGGNCAGLKSIGCGVESISQTNWLILRFSSVSLRSWSIVIDKSLSLYHTELKLTKFKEMVKLKKHVLAFGIYPLTAGAYNDGPDTLNADWKIFKRIFPSVPLITLFNTSDVPIYGIDSTDKENTSLNTVYHDHIVYALVTYD